MNGALLVLGGSCRWSWHCPACPYSKARYRIPKETAIHPEPDRCKRSLADLKSPKSSKCTLPNSSRACWRGCLTLCLIVSRLPKVDHRIVSIIDTSSIMNMDVSSTEETFWLSSLVKSSFVFNSPSSSKRLCMVDAETGIPSIWIFAAAIPVGAHALTLILLMMHHKNTSEADTDGSKASSRTRSRMQVQA